MLPVVSKIISFFVSPLGLSLLLLGIAAALRRQAGWTRALCFGAFLLLFLFSSGTVSQLLLRSLEDQYHMLPLDSIPRAEAIVVLGGGTSNDQTIPGELDGISIGSANRLLYAARLFRAGKAPLILFSGGVPLLRRSLSQGSEAQAAVQLLKEWEVPGQAILLEDRSRSTRESALLSRQILQSRGISRILLVTSAYHMPRAAPVFRKLGFQVIPAPPDVQTADGGALSRLFLPDPESLAKSASALREWLDFFVYRLRGWV
jgi:uncharacterized SAM-binding protein YcdF (DUF218 family)